MADDIPEFGFLTSLVDINFPGGKFLTIECSFVADSPASLNGEAFDFILSPTFFPNLPVLPALIPGQITPLSLFPTTVLSWADPAAGKPVFPPKVDGHPLSADALARSIIYPLPPDATKDVTDTTGAGVAVMNVSAISSRLAKDRPPGANPDITFPFTMQTSPHGFTQPQPVAKVWFVYSNQFGDITDFTTTTFAEDFFNTDNPYDFLKVTGVGVLNIMVADIVIPGFDDPVTHTERFSNPYPSLETAQQAAAQIASLPGTLPQQIGTRIQEWDLGPNPPPPPIVKGKCSWIIKFSTYRGANDFNVDGAGAISAVNKIAVDPNTGQKTPTVLHSVHLYQINSGGNKPPGFKIDVTVNMNDLTLNIKQSPVQ